MTLPNQITIARLVLSIVLFALLHHLDAADLRDRLLAVLSFAVFLLIALTDFLDGYLARRWNVETSFGRIADPFVDKIAVCGTFIFLAAAPRCRDLVPAWAVVVIVGREFLVTGIRGWIESLGVPFGADPLGKAKMVVQCVSLGFVLGYFALFDESSLIFTLAGWLVAAAVILTVLSGANYVLRALRLVRSG